jgi:hypothetical protein
MNFRKQIYEQSLKKKIRESVYEYAIKEGIYTVSTEEGLKLRPDLKYYAFDWDDNIMFMPTKIMVMSENEDEVGMSTEDVAEHRHQIGEEDFNYKGTTIVGYTSDPFKYFREAGDNKFIIDSMTAPVGPAWNDFVECINGGSIFAIITARGHNPEVLRKAIFNLIAADHNGIRKKELIDNLRKYHKIYAGLTTIKEDIDEKKFVADFDDSNLVIEYLDRCLMAPVSFGEGSASNPEEGKKKALRKFISDCRQTAGELIHSILRSEPNVKLSDLRPQFKNDVANNEIMDDIEDFLTKNVKIGFSDDDPKNVEKTTDMVSQEYEDEPISIYLTKGGEKKKYN